MSLMTRMIKSTLFKRLKMTYYSSVFSSREIIASGSLYLQGFQSIEKGWA